MRIRDTKEEAEKENVAEIALSEVSILSVIRMLSKNKISLDQLIELKSQIKKIECSLWSLLPLAMEKHEMFDQIKTQLQGQINAFIGAADYMNNIAKEDIKKEENGDE